MLKNAIMYDNLGVKWVVKGFVFFILKLRCFYLLYTVMCCAGVIIIPTQLLQTQPKSESVLNWSILVSCHWNCSKWICTATKANLWDSWFFKIHYWEQWAWPKEIFCDSVTRTGFGRWLSYSSFVAVWHWIVLIESQHFFSQTVTFETWLNWLWLILRSRNLDFVTQFLYFIIFL